MLTSPASRLCRLLPLFVAVLSGCTENRTSAPVSGRVTLNGEPQEGIFIYFKPVIPPKSNPMQAGTGSYGRTDADGRYTLNFMDRDKDRPGALIAKHTVTADDDKTFGSRQAADEAGTMKPIESRVPADWSETFVVPPEGTTEANFDLGKKAPTEE